MKQQTPGRQGQTRTRSATERAEEDQRDAAEPLISQRGAPDRRSYYKADEYVPTSYPMDCSLYRKKKKVERLFATNLTDEQKEKAAADAELRPSTSRPIDFADVTLSIE